LLLKFYYKNNRTKYTKTQQR